MSMYWCSACETVKDKDREPCEVFEDGREDHIICESCLAGAPEDIGKLYIHYSDNKWYAVNLPKNQVFTGKSINHLLEQIREYYEEN